MTTRSETIARVTRRRHAVAGERRRLLAFALHAGSPDLDLDVSNDDDIDFDDEVTRERPVRRGARGTWGPQLDELRAQTAAYRAQAIALNAKLAMHEHTREELRVVREQLAESSARIEHAVEDIDAFAALDEQLSVLTPTDGD